MTTGGLNQVAVFWRGHQAEAVVGAAVVIMVVLAWSGWRLYRSRERSKVVSTLAAVLVMAWTSEGLLAVALYQVRLPLPFALMTFTVFEMMMLAAGLKAEEHRSTKGVPGPAGRYVFLIATVSGVIACLGAASTAERLLRVALPPLAVGLWWIGLAGERPTDNEQVRAERARRAAQREATWVWTPRTVLVRFGVMKPGATTVTDAQREHQVNRMVVAADTIALGGHRVRRARTRLRRLARTATPAMVAEVARRQRQAAEAETRMVTVGGPDRRTHAAAPPPTSVGAQGLQMDTHPHRDSRAVPFSVPGPVALTAQVPPASVPPPVRQPTAGTKVDARTTQPDNGASTKDKPGMARRLREQHPEWTVADIAHRLDVSERSVQRYLNGGEKT
jgi:hypothetical protein